MKIGWRIDVSSHAITQHLYYDSEESARDAFKTLTAAMQEFREFGLNRDAPRTVRMTDDVSETECAIRSITAARLIDERAWDSLLEARLESDAEKAARNQAALERATGRLAAGVA